MVNEAQTHHRTDGRDHRPPSGAACVASVVPAMLPDRDRTMTAHQYSPVTEVRVSFAASIPLGPFAMYEAFPRSDYYGPSASPRSHRQTTRQPDPQTSGKGRRSGASWWFPRSLLTARGVRCPAMPLRYRHGYAAGIHRGLRRQRPKPQPEFPTPKREWCWCASQTSPNPPG